MIVLEITSENGRWEATYAPLNITVSAGSMVDLMREFMQEAKLRWEEYAQVDDSKLTDDALKLKEKLFEINGLYKDLLERGEI